MEFSKAKKMRDTLEENSRQASTAMREFPTGLCGLTPDHVKATQEWKNARKKSQIAFKALQDFNKWFVKEFADELKQERRERRERRTHA